MRDDFSFVAEPGQPTLIMRRSFDAPRTDVFEAWTNADQVAQWWDPTGTPLAVCEIDLRVGRATRYVWQHRDGALATGMTSGMADSYAQLDSYLASLQHAAKGAA